MHYNRVIPLKLIKEISGKVGLDLEYFLKNGFWVALRYLFVSIFGLIISAGLVRWASKELVGQYYYVIAIVSLFSFLSLSGLNIVALRAVIERKEWMVRCVVRKSFFSSLIAVPLLLLYASYLYLFSHDEASNAGTILAIVAAAIIFPFFYAPNTWYVAYEGNYQYRKVTIRILVSSFVSSALFLIGAWMGYGLATLVALHFGVSAVFSWLYYFEFQKTLNQGDADDHRITDSDFRYGLAITFQKLIFNLTETLPPIAISFFLGFEYLANFQIAYILFGAGSAFVGAISTIYIPKLFQSRNIFYKKILVQSFVSGVIIALLFSVFLKLFFLSIYGLDYTISYSIALLLSPLFVAVPLRYLLMQFFTTRKMNLLLVLTYIFSNVSAFLAFLYFKNYDPKTAVTIYIYSLTIFALLILVPFYLAENRRVSKGAEIQKNLQE